MKIWISVRIFLEGTSIERKGFFSVHLGILYADSSDIVILRNLSSRHRLTLLISPTNIDFTQDNLRCLLVDQPASRSRVSDLVDPSSSHSGVFFLSDYRAIHLSTASPSVSSKTFGYVKVYQSRMNIDLFVFFSVFFSSFFLFLSIGICFWKVKFAYELHRRRRTIKHEYHKRMARPFSKIQLFIKPSTILAAEVDDKSEQVSRRRPSRLGVFISLSLVALSRAGCHRYSTSSSIHSNRYRLFNSHRRSRTAAGSKDLLHDVAFPSARRSLDAVPSLCRNDSHPDSSWLCQRLESRTNRSRTAETTKKISSTKSTSVESIAEEVDDDEHDNCRSNESLLVTGSSSTTKKSQASSLTAPGTVRPLVWRVRCVHACVFSLLDCIFSSFVYSILLQSTHFSNHLHWHGVQAKCYIF